MNTIVPGPPDTESGTYRILVTGSRDWTDRDAIARALSAAHRSLHEQHYDRPMDPESDPIIILVSGACPTGADALAEDVWGRLPLERHPADWRRYGKRAGFVRNAGMVSSGASICLAFIRNGSRGASMTAALAEKAGIATYRYEVSD